MVTDNGRQFHKVRFMVTDDESFEGWTNGSLWNGWDCPAFERPAADMLAKTVNDTSVESGYVSNLIYDATKDAYLYSTEDDEFDDGPEAFEGYDIDTPEGCKHVYAIGAWSWVWKEVGE